MNRANFLSLFPATVLAREPMPSSPPDPMNPEEVLQPGQLAVLRVEPGDVLVLRTDRVITSDMASSMRETVEGNLPPGVKVMVLSGGIEIGVLRPPTQEDER
jgi:hypothetical protein